MEYLKINEKISLHRFGTPLKTGAVTLDLTGNDFSEKTEINHLNISYEQERINLVYNLKPEDRIFGLGETLGCFNKRGMKFRLFNSDDPVHTPEKESLYGTHCLFMVDGEESFGIFIDYPGEMILDIGFSKKNIFKISVSDNNFDLYIFKIDTLQELTRNYLHLCGTPYIPPAWAFGYQQSRWSYPDADSVNDIADHCRNLNIPCDAIFLDIDYMDNYKVFTVSDDKFPDFAKYVKKLKKAGFKLIPIIDPGVKIESGYSMYEEGKENNYFCKDNESNDFTAACWPGKIHFPDFLSPEVRLWWGNHHKEFLENGIEGFWIDMNEPSIFYAPSALSSYFEQVKEIESLEDPGFELFRLKWLSESLANHPDYYRSFFHNNEGIQKVTNESVHNLFGFKMAEATVEGFKKYLPGKRYFLVSRSSFSGQHRISAVWAGDNMSWWEHLIVHIRMLLSLGISGFFYSGSDVGGFGCNSSADLVIRWTQLGAFTPFFRNHSATGTRSQEPWAFDDDTLNIVRETIRTRYSLFPYIYSEFMRSVRDFHPFVSPLMMFFDSERVKGIEDQFMFGESLMITPVIERNAIGRYVHLPECNWLLWKSSKWHEHNCVIYKSGDYFIETGLEEIPVFMRENTLMIQAEPQNYIGETIITELFVTGLVTDEAVYEYYTDNGEDSKHKDGEFSTLTITVNAIDDSFDIKVKINENFEVPMDVNRLSFELYGSKKGVYKETITLTK